MPDQIFKSPWIFVFILASIPLFGVVADAKPSEREECVVIAELASGKVIFESNKEVCTKRLPACSTFKIPLAVMAFDTGVMKNETQTLKWDGSKQFIKAWEQDHNAKSWLKESVVWFSQRLTPDIGIARINEYLNNFDYGNKDFSGGIKTAWLSSSLQISPNEQISFLRKLNRHHLRIKESVADKVISILPTEVDKSDIKISGKTGSGSQESNGDYRRVGWYVGFADKNKKQYVFAVAFSDHAEKGKFYYSGGEAKEIAIKAMEKIK